MPPPPSLALQLLDAVLRCTLFAVKRRQADADRERGGSSSGKAAAAVKEADDERDSLLSSPREIWRQTRRSLPLLLLPCVPLDVIGLAAGLPFASVSALRVPRMLSLLYPPLLRGRVARLGGLLAKVDLPLPGSLLKLGSLVLMTCLIAHWLGCLLFLIADSAPDDTSSWVESDGLRGASVGTQVRPPLPAPPPSRASAPPCRCSRPSHWVLMPLPLPSLLMQWLRAFYASLATLLVCPIGDIVPTNSAETTMWLFVILFGVSINAALIGEVSTVITNLDADVTAHGKRHA